MATPKTLKLIVMRLYQYPKDKLISSVNSIRNHLIQIVNLEILQSDWLRGFWPVSQAQDFS